MPRSRQRATLEEGPRLEEAITRQQIMATVEAVADRGSYVIADKVLALIRAIYNWASATGRLEVDLTRGLKKRNASRPRERILSKAEIRSLWCDLDASSISLEIRDALGLQLLLGLRISEVLGANKSEINLVHRVWIIPAARTKSNREQRLPLPPWRQASYSLPSSAPVTPLCFSHPRSTTERCVRSLQCARYFDCERNASAHASVPSSRIGVRRTGD